jgi:hypothetical protein
LFSSQSRLGMLDARFEVFTTMKIHAIVSGFVGRISTFRMPILLSSSLRPEDRQVTVFCVATPRSIVVGYQSFRGLCCPYFHFSLKMDAVWSFETLILYQIITRHHNSDDHDLKFGKLVLYGCDMWFTPWL